jgi:hypothetical protein
MKFTRNKRHNPPTNQLSKIIDEGLNDLQSDKKINADAAYIQLKAQLKNKKPSMRNEEISSHLDGEEPQINDDFIRTTLIVDDKNHRSFVKQLEPPAKENLALKALIKNKSPWEK